MTDNATVLAGRLLLAAVNDDEHAHRLAADSVPACAGCWRRVAAVLLAVAAGEIVTHHPDDAVEHAAAFIEYALDHRGTP